MQTDLPRNSFKKGLRDGQKQIGFWLTLASPSATELASGSGFDWLLIDMEHSPNDLVDVVNHMRASVGGTAEPIVRVPWNDFVLVKRLLDAGARSLLFPYVQTAVEARRAVEATRYPPHGIRGMGGVTRATRYGRIPDYINRAAEELCVIVQVESPAAIDAIPEMATIEGLDAIFVGPSDLSANAGHIGNPGHSEVQALIAKALKSIKAAGKGAGILTYNVEAAKKQFDMGFDFIAVGGDSPTLARAADALVKQFKVKAT